MSSPLDLDRSIAVIGPPGTERTALLVGRTVALLRAGVPPSRVAVLCPSSRAADRVRERVRDALEAAGDETPMASPVCTTITALAQSLLAREALPARHAPGVRLGPVLIPNDLLNSWSDWLRSTRPALAALATQLGALDDVSQAAEILWEHRDLDVVASPLAFDAEAAHAELIIVRDALESALGQCLDPESSPLLVSNRSLRRELGAWTLMSPPEGVVAALTSSVVPAREEGTGDYWHGDSREMAQSTLDMVEAWRERWTQAAHGALVRALVFELLPRVERHRHARGATDPADLLLRLAGLLESDAAARTRLSAGFDAWLVDDVDQGPAVQARIVALLARAPEAEGPWTARPPRSGALFAAGRGDSAHGRQLTELISRRGISITLERNRAPAPALWIASQNPIRDTVGWVFSAVAGGLDARNIVIAVPAWIDAARLRDGLAAAGIGAVIDGGGTSASEPWRLLRSALICMNDPAETVALIHVLRGLFALSPGALALHSLEGGSWHYLDPEQPIGRVAQAFSALRDLRLDRRGSWLPPLRGLLDLCAARATWSRLVRGPGWLADVDIFLGRLEQAEERCPGSEASVREFLRTEGECQPGEHPTDTLLITSPERAASRSAEVVVLVDGSPPQASVPAVVHRGRLFLALGSRLVPSGTDAALAAQLKHRQLSRSALVETLAHHARDRFVVLAGSVAADGDVPGLVDVCGRAEHLDGDRIPLPAQDPRAFGDRDAVVEELLRTPSAWRDRAPPSDSRPIRSLPVGGAPRPDMADQPVLESLRLAPEQWLGVGFSVPSDDGSVQGVLDACFPVDPGRRRWVVIDWTAPPGEPGLQAELTECALRALGMITPCRTVEVHMIGPERAAPALLP